MTRRAAPAGPGVRDAAAAVAVRVDGRPLVVPAGTLVAAALEIAAPGRGGRRAAGGQRRQAFCGMGVCGECRATIGGQAHRLGCQVLCTAGLEVTTDV